MTPWRAVQVAVVLLVVVVLSFQLLGEDEEPAGMNPQATPGGASGLPAPPVRTRVEVDTPELRAAKADAGIDDCPAPGDVAAASAAPGADDLRASELPPLTLECLGGGPDTVLSSVTGPAVVNLWASWCTPCEKELPILARLDEQAGDRLTVLGVDYQDPDPEAALDLLAASGVTYPQLADPGGSLADQLKILGLPGTVFVDAEGVATFVNAAFDSDEELAALVREHTGVDPAAG